MLYPVVAVHAVNAVFVKEGEVDRVTGKVFVVDAVTKTVLVVVKFLVRTVFCRAMILGLFS